MMLLCRRRLTFTHYPLLDKSCVLYHKHVIEYSRLLQFGDLLVIKYNVSCFEGYVYCGALRGATQKAETFNHPLMGRQDSLVVSVLD